MDKKTDKFEETQDNKKNDLLSRNYGDNAAINLDSDTEDLYNEGVDRKLIFIIILIFVVIIGFIFWYNGSQLKKTVAIDVPDWAIEQTEEKTEREKISELQQKDTDQDGLTDYQELYQYGTSIFLADTDSDGFSDQEEILQGYDALCPSGQDCGLLRLVTPKTKMAEIVDDVNSTELTMEQAALNEFRMFLVQNGYTQEEVDEMPDEQLLAILSVMAEVTSEEIANTSTTPEQVRQFLLSQPEADEEAINSLTDEELMEISKKFIRN